MVKVFMIRIETTHFDSPGDAQTKWEETQKALRRAAGEYFYEPEVTVDEIKIA